MAHKQKGQLATTSEWAKHLRQFLKRQYWKRERKAGIGESKKQMEENH